MITAVAASPSIDVTYVVEAVRPGEIHRPHLTRRVAGGKGLNVARVAHRLGADVRALTLLGGTSGRWVAAELAALGLPLSSVQVEAETRTCVSVAEAASHLMTEVYEQSGPVTDAEWSAFLASVQTAAAGRPGWLAVSGSMPPPDLSPARIDAVVRIGHRHGLSLAVDAHGASLRAAVEAGADVVKVNAEEAAHLLGVDPGTPVQALAERLAAQVPVGAVVTAGVDGVWAVRRDGVRRHLASATRGTFPVGSGDCLLAGLVVGLDRGEDLLHALTLATAVATANALTPGAGCFADDDVRTVVAALSP